MKSKTKEPAIADANAKSDFLNKIPSNAKIIIFDVVCNKTASFLKNVAEKWKGMTAADHLRVGAIVLFGAEAIYTIFAAQNKKMA